MMQKKKKRVFIGIGISHEIREKISKFKELHEETPLIRWVPEENLHVTLIPPWNEKEIENLVNLLSKIPFKVEPFDLVFDRITLGPNPKRPRLIWIEGKNNPYLIELKNLLETKLQRKSLHKEFRPHITIARFKGRKLRNLTIARLNKEINWKQKVKSFLLYEAKLLPSGARYKVLKEVKLCKPPHKGT